MQHTYSVYGVSLSSDTPFEFPAGPPRPDRPCVRFARADAWDVETIHAPPDGFVIRELADGSLYLRWTGLFEFLIDASGTCVRYRALADGTPAVLQNFLLGQTLSFALVRQNVEPIHAAVVAIGSGAVALLGDCTYGKSTLAAALLKAGCRLVSDDLLIVGDTADGFTARPGAGRIKLHPDSARAMLGDATAGVRLLPRAEKRMFQLHPSLVQRTDVPLRAFVVLPTPDERAASARVELRRIGGPALVCELVRNTFVRYVDDPQRLHQNFSWNARVASGVPGFHLTYPAGLDRLPEVVDALIDRLRRLMEENHS